MDGVGKGRLGTWATEDEGMETRKGIENWDKISGLAMKGIYALMTWIEIKGVTHLLMLTLETHSSTYCNFRNKIRAVYYITISYQIKDVPSDFHAIHALHAIISSIQVDFLS